jgi:hypothetical protein
MLSCSYKNREMLLHQEQLGEVRHAMHAWCMAECMAQWHDARSMHVQRPLKPINCLAWPDNCECPVHSTARIISAAPGRTPNTPWLCNAVCHMQCSTVECGGSGGCGSSQGSTDCSTVWCHSDALSSRSISTGTCCTRGGARAELQASTPAPGCAGQGD